MTKEYVWDPEKQEFVPVVLEKNDDKEGGGNKKIKANCHKKGGGRLLVEKRYRCFGRKQ